VAIVVRARIHVLLARDAPFGVVIRRGPARHVALLGWDRETDRFERGQWLKGRIYEHRCDLSPDGKHFLYFALNARWHQEAKGSWTALSRAPYLKALALWPEGDTWGGGGLFLSNQKYWLTNGPGEPLRDESGLRCIATLPAPISGFADRGLYFARIQRDGWTKRPDLSATHAITVFEKPLSDEWMLRKRAHMMAPNAPGRSYYFDEHDLVNTHTGEISPHPEWEWADRDRDRLVWAEAGQLWTGRLTSAGLEHASMLFDFDPLRFENRVAPY
jgi:hypothetical protein